MKKPAGPICSFAAGVYGLILKKRMMSVPLGKKRSSFLILMIEHEWTIR